MPLGAHMSIAGGIYKAILRGKSVGCETIQIFTKNCNQWRAKPLTPEDLARFEDARRKTGITPIFAHTSYLINLGSPQDELWEKSLAGFLVEMERCAALGLPYLVTHPGAHAGAGEEAGLRRIAQALNEILAQAEGSGVMVLLETTAGQGSNLGYRFEHFAQIIEDSFYPDRLGVCFDTCHAFAAGYDFRTPETFAKTFETFEATIGINRLKAIHLNDSRCELGSRRDRHEHIGLGKIGLEGFRLLLNDRRLCSLPMVLETPKGPEMKEDVENLMTLKNLIRT